MSKIDDIRLKLERAHTHLENFKATLLGDQGPIYPARGVGVHYEGQGQDIAISTDAPKPEQQLWWGILLGDVIHQTRACLDHVIYALATRNGPVSEKEAKRLRFPICQKPGDFTADASVSDGFLERMIGSEEFAALQEAQPYKRNRRELWILKCLDDIDKHRTVLVMDDRVKIEGTVYSDDGVHKQPFRIIKEPLKAKTEVFNIPWVFPRPPAAVSVDNIAKHVVFTEPKGLCDNQAVIPLMRDIIAQVLETLISFDRFFPF